MATEDNTVVTFDMIKDPISYIGQTPGEDIVVTLNKFESYTIGIDHADYDNLTINNSNGTRITSNNPIVCNSGSWLAGNQQGQCIGSDQLVPAEVTGQEYILVRGLGDETTERPMVVATEDNTEVYLNGNAAPAAVLDEGEFFIIPTAEFSGNDNLYVLATEKVYMFQTLSGSSTNIGQTVGLNFIPPLNCIGAKEVNLPFVNSLFNNGNGNAQINIITKNGTSIFVNEDPTPITGAQTVPGNPDWVSYAFNAPSNNVIIESDSVMNVALITQSGNVGAAGYFSGFTLEPVVGLSSGISGSSPCIPGNAVLQVFGFDAYQWYFDGEEIPGATNSTLFPEFSGSYVVEGIDIACGFRFPSNSFAIPFCPSTLGAAKGVQNISETAPGSNIFDITYRIFIENLAESPSQNIQVMENIEGGLPVGATAELIGAPTIAFGILTGGINPDFNGTTDRRLLPGNGGLPGEAADAIDLVIRIDMNAAEQDGYFNQITVTSKNEGVNNGVDGPFNGQDFSDAGNNPDTNGNGEPNEDGENDPTLTCFFTNDISYDALMFCTADPVQDVTIAGISTGVFTVDNPGLELDPFTGAIDPGMSDPGTYNITFSVDGRCPTTTFTEVTIVLLPVPGVPVDDTEICVESGVVNLDDYITGADPGGVWTDASGGLVDGTFDPFAPGDVSFIYTVSAEPCSPQSVVLTLQVVSPPSVGVVVDNPSVCLTEGQTLLSDYLIGEEPGGVWTDASGSVVSDEYTLTSDGGFGFTYTVETNNCGPQSISFILNVVPFPDSGVSVGDATVCAGEEIDLMDFLVGADPDGVWTDADGNEVDPIETITAIGEQTYTYTIDRQPCGEVSTSVNLNVQQGPNAGNPNNPVLLCVDGPSVNLMTLVPGADPGGVWTDADGNTVSDFFDPTQVGEFSFEYTVSSAECGDISSELVIEVGTQNCDQELIIPQGFSPNGDGIADFWVIQGLTEGYPNNRVRIYNRWGSLVYSAGPYNNDWDGRSQSGIDTGEILPVGTYFYTIEFGDDTEAQSGYVYLNK
jgi:gliding motility-associated-like protein